MGEILSRRDTIKLTGAGCGIAWFAKIFGISAVTSLLYACHPFYTDVRSGEFKELADTESDLPSAAFLDKVANVEGIWGDNGVRYLSETYPFILRFARTIPKVKNKDGFPVYNDLSSIDPDNDVDLGNHGKSRFALLKRMRQVFPQIGVLSSLYDPKSLLDSAACLGEPDCDKPDTIRDFYANVLFESIDATAKGKVGTGDMLNIIGLYGYRELLSLQSVFMEVFSDVSVSLLYDGRYSPYLKDIEYAESDLTIGSEGFADILDSVKGNVSSTGAAENEFINYLVSKGILKMTNDGSFLGKFGIEDGMFSNACKETLVYLAGINQRGGVRDLDIKLWNSMRKDSNSFHELLSKIIYTNLPSATTILNLKSSLCCKLSLPERIEKESCDADQDDYFVVAMRWVIDGYHPNLVISERDCVMRGVQQELFNDKCPNLYITYFPDLDRFIQLFTSNDLYHAHSSQAVVLFTDEGVPVLFPSISATNLYTIWQKIIEKPKDWVSLLAYSGLENYRLDRKKSNDGLIQGQEKYNLLYSEDCHRFVTNSEGKEINFSMIFEGNRLIAAMNRDILNQYFSGYRLEGKMLGFMSKGYVQSGCVENSMYMLSGENSSDILGSVYVENGVPAISYEKLDKDKLYKIYIKSIFGNYTFLYDASKYGDIDSIMDVVINGQRSITRFPDFEGKGIGLNLRAVKDGREVQMRLENYQGL